ncbi:hypothetical protein SHAb15599_00166 [Acinetobacter phage SH-Ab 15599]|nr:hypothetical protein SHAb15599_00166 [Acinetobacter phage SH-Ab 15599]
MKLKNIVSQYNVTVEDVSNVVNGGPNNPQMNIENGDLYMRQRYNDNKFGKWKCVAKVTNILVEIQNEKSHVF